jgi:hypothetical protein
MPPADVLTAYSSSRPQCRVSLAAFSNLSDNGAPPVLGRPWALLPVVAASVGSKAAVDGVCWWLPGPSV